MIDLPWHPASVVKASLVDGFNLKNKQNIPRVIMQETNKSLEKWHVSFIKQFEQ